MRKREAHGLSMTAAAEKLRICQGHLGNIEVGRDNPSLPLLILMARFYRVFTDSLLL